MTDAPDGTNATAQGFSFDFNEFASMAGFSEGLATLAAKGEAKWTNTATHMHTGGIHGLRYKVQQGKDGTLDVIVQHWTHKPEGKNRTAAKETTQDADILVFRARLETDAQGRRIVHPVDARWMDKTYTQRRTMIRLMHILKDISDAIRDNIARQAITTEFNDRAGNGAAARSPVVQRDEIPNLYAIAERNGMKTSLRREGMRYNGEFAFAEAGRSARAPAYPLQLLRAMLGVEENIVLNDAQPFGKTFSLTTENGYQGVTYDFSPGANQDRIDLTCRLWSNNDKMQREETILYSVGCGREGDSNMFRVDRLEMLGNRPDLKDHKGVARTLRAMKYINLAIQRGEAPRFSDILHEHDLKAYLRRPSPPLAFTPERPRTLFQVFGANLDAVFTQREKSIGSNGMIIIRDFMDASKKWVKLGIGVDWGVTFGDPKKDFYHTVAPNYGRFTGHPSAPHIKPYVDTILNLETHEHEDHLRGVARLAKFGYTLPPMVVNPHTARVLERMMSEEGVPSSKIAEIKRRLHIVDTRIVAATDDPDLVTTHHYGDTVVKQSVETIWSETEQRNKYFPLLTVYPRAHPVAKTTIRVGPAGHSAHALMFEVEGILYSGDYKLDQSLPAGLRTDLDWLAKCRESAVHIQESTNAGRMEAMNAPVSLVMENRKTLLALEPEKRVLFDQIGSNAVDMEMFCRAVGEVRRESMEAGAGEPYGTIILAGTAVRNKYGDLNKTDSFKAMMKREYEIDTLHIDSKKAQTLLEQSEGSYIVIMTGTQDEPLSLTHRVSRDLHDTIVLKPGDVIIRGQTPIPGDRREAIRRQQNDRYRHDFGCTVYDAGEMARQGFPIYTSSHASRADYQAVHEATGDLLKVLTHGGPQQLAAMKTLMDDMGARTVTPDKQAVYEVDRENKTISVAGETPEERVGYREIRSDPDKFYEKHRQQATVIRVTDRWHGPVAARMYAFENAVTRQLGLRHGHKATDRGANITGEFDRHASAFPKIGIFHPSIERPYQERHKNIKLFVCMDTEGTGTNVALDVHTDASFVAVRPDGEVIGEKTLLHRLRRYLLTSPGALTVTRNEQPEALHERGLTLRQYVRQLYDVYRAWVPELAGDPKARGVFAGWNNGKYDDLIAMRMFGMGLAGHDMKPMATHGNLQLDLRHLYTALIALVPDKIGFVRDAQGNVERTLGAACASNGITYADDEKHGSLYDAHLVRHLLFKFRAAAPDIFEQMLMNCDFSASRASPMVDQILGQDMHLNDQAPVFGYVSMRDRKCTPRLGALVTIHTEEGSASEAIVLDLAKADIHQLEHLSDENLQALMDDPDGPFAVVKMNNSPCWFPPDFVWNDPKIRARAVGKLPKSTLASRANALKQLRSADGGAVGNNLIQRVQRLYPQSALAFDPARTAVKGAPANDNIETRAFRLPNERIFSLFRIMSGVNQIKSRYYRQAARLLRTLQPGADETETNDPAGFWRRAVVTAKGIVEAAHGPDRQVLEDFRFLIEWLAEDEAPEALDVADRKRINALKSAMLHGSEHAHTMTVERFMRELATIERDPSTFQRLVGEGAEAQEKWQSLKVIYKTYAEGMDANPEYKMTDEKRDYLRTFRRNTNGGPGLRFG